MVSVQRCSHGSFYTCTYNLFKLRMILFWSVFWEEFYQPFSLLDSQVCTPNTQTETWVVCVKAPVQASAAYQSLPL